ncbi:MAG TPA: DUF4870 domain-containing protein [Rhodanobacteraceae bacterium]|nr:DUF4870 domain-containing protein [Rhodanobacteraceae bacterium]
MSVPPESATPPPAAPPPAAGSSADDRNIALITHLSGIILGFIVPLIVWLIHKDRTDKPYLIEQSKEALNFQITILIGYVICWVLTFIIIGALLGFLLWIVNIVFCILAAVAVSKGENYRYPFALRLIN